MILPNNGKIVIIDDVPDEVEKLMSALTKEKMPCLFYHDQGALDLPDTPISNVRLVFLDLDLGIGGNDPKQKIRIIQQRIIRILKERTPYVLIIWSNHEPRYKEFLLQEFEGDFKLYKPVAHCSLDKSVLKQQGVNIVDVIRQSLKEQLLSINSFNEFLLWESCVNNAAGVITNNLVNIFEKNANWDKNISNLLFNLSRAITGTEIMKALTDKEKLTTAFEIINTSLMDTIELVYQSKLGEITINEIKEGGNGIQPSEKIKINTSIHLIRSDALNHYFSGNVYLKDLSAIGEDILKHNFKDSKLLEIKNSNPQLVCLDITPACDYSQRKNYSRILYGVKVGGAFSKSDLRDEDSRYKLCPIMDFDAASFVILDYRHFVTFSKADFDLSFIEKPKYRLRKNLLFDIQAQLSSHINRPGIVSM